MRWQSYLIREHCRRKAAFTFPSVIQSPLCASEQVQSVQKLLNQETLSLQVLTTKELLNATDMAIEMKQKGVLGKPCPDYTDETVSMKVVRIIQGYVNVVNKMVWRKDI